MSSFNTGDVRRWDSELGFNSQHSGEYIDIWFYIFVH